MTAHKHRKQRVRRRAERTGESYTAALRYLRPPMTEEKMEAAGWRRIEKPEFGYTVSIPGGWVETPPDLRNSPWETARFGTPEDRRHDVVVFRQPVISGQTAADIVANAKSHLEGYGFGEFHVEHVTVASREGLRLDFATTDAERTWSSQQYYFVDGNACFCVGYGSTAPEEIREIIDAMVASFALMG